ncbi:MAG TPA: hypothetical protein VJL89_11280 [Thermodesulfovibrionia bacterium]|nr:hypothetical protein [Thermodesulfovibrionia bacterium]
MTIPDKILSLWRIPEGADKVLCEAYRRLWKKAVVVTVVLAIIPILILMYVNFNQFGTTILREKSFRLLNQTLTVKQYLESSLNKRMTTVQMATFQQSLPELNEPDKLASRFKSMQSTFSDLAAVMVYNMDGNLSNKAGMVFLQNQIPLLDLNHETEQGIPEITDVFHDQDTRFYYAIVIPYSDKSHLLAIFDTTVLNQITSSVNMKQDIFLINHDSVLQTGSRYYGPAMSKFSAAISSAVMVQDGISSAVYNHNEYYFAEIAQSPFVLVIGEPLLNLGQALSRWLSFENKPLVFFLFSTVFGLFFIMASAAYLIALVRDADIQRAAML